MRMVENDQGPKRAKWLTGRSLSLPGHPCVAPVAIIRSQQPRPVSCAAAVGIEVRSHELHRLAAWCDQMLTLGCACSGYPKGGDCMPNMKPLRDRGRTQGMY